VQHGSGTTLAQDQVANKRNEITAVPALLAGRDLTDTVVTMDALLTQRALAQQIVDQGGHYLMIVKRNQPQLHDNLALFFDLPAIAADQEHWDQHQTTTKGQGRIELRTLESTTGDCAALGWPGAVQLLRRTCERTVQKTGKCTVTVTYGITRVPPSEANAALLERLWRGHSTIESQSHRCHAHWHSSAFR
jgi:predicted transposase YbfD/YdcC